jgi:hypothetical protein
VKRYVQIAKSYPWLLDCVESFLFEAGRDVVHLPRALKKLRAKSGRPLSNDETLLAITALADLGIVDDSPGGRLFNKERFAETMQLRLGIRTALEVATAEFPAQGEATICVSTPPSLSEAANQTIRDSCIDLRSGLIDLVSSATESIIIA